MTNMKMLALLLALCLGSCVPHGAPDGQSGQLSDHKARTLAVWSGWQNKDIKERVVPAPAVLLDYLRKDNKLNGFEQVPRSPTQWRPFADEVCEAIDEFPPEVRKQLNEHAVGIFLVSDLGSSAYAEVVKDAAPRSLGFIVLDDQALNKKANEWATWKENTPFEPSSGLEARMIIEPEAGDRRKNALSYILLHELGHLVGVAEKAHVSWWGKANPEEYPFSAISWTEKNGAVVSRWDETFGNRKKVKFYADEKSRLPGDERLGIYTGLAKTDFVSLYAATGIYDDFAETYAMYVHVVMQKRPWELEILKDGKSILKVTEPIRRERFQAKRAFLETLFAPKSPAPAPTANIVK